MRRFLSLPPRSLSELRARTSTTINSAKMSSTSVVTEDPTQLLLMKENCIVVDKDDKIISVSDKKTCHTWKKIEEEKLLHRAFSAFVFNPKGELLLQKRARTKITFPSMWTNTCCSHPLADFTGENDERDDGEDHKGVKRAARRKLEHELGIPQSDLTSIDKFQWLGRIHYQAPENSEWGEHEIDHILFLVADIKIPNYVKDNQPEEVVEGAIVPNENEVCNLRYVSQKELRQMFEESQKYSFTPWFRKIYEDPDLLAGWWGELENSGVKDAFGVKAQDKHKFLVRCPC